MKCKLNELFLFIFIQEFIIPLLPLFFDSPPLNKKIYFFLKKKKN
jgi:hypothetical protein